MWTDESRISKALRSIEVVEDPWMEVGTYSFGLCGWFTTNSTRNDHYMGYRGPTHEFYSLFTNPVNL